jgi:subtilase family serine protease
MALIRIRWFYLFFFFGCYAWPNFAMAKPDLIVESFTGVPSRIMPSDALNVKVCVKNIGTSPSAAFQVGIFFSTDDNITKFDSIQADTTFAGLAKDAAACQSISFNLSGDAVGKAGIFWLGAIADWNEQSNEILEDNNASQAHQISIAGADLVIDSFTGVPVMPKSGDAMSLQVCVKNQGVLNVSRSFNVGVYYSSSQEISRLDTLLVDFDITSLAAGASICRNLTANVPAQANIDTGYIGVLADTKDEIVEERKNNNTKAVALTPRPDLIVTAINGSPQIIKAGSQIPLEVCVQNIGTADALAFKTGIYYSDNDVITASDTLLAEVAFTGLGKQLSACQKVSVKMPAVIVQLGDNWLGAFVDHEQKIAELNETNNTLAVKFINPAPDLVVADIRGVPALATPKTPLALEICIRNDGSDDVSKAYKAAIYHSVTPGISVADTRLVELTFANTPSLQPGQTVCQKANATLPDIMPIGDNWVGVIVDTNGDIAESNENNNTASRVFKNPAPDLIIESISGVPTTATAGDSLNLMVCTKNIGSLDTQKSFKFAIYHSDNDIITSFDTKIGEMTIASLAKDSSICRSIQVKLPNVIAAGDNWLGAIIDSDSEIQEEDETNNTFKVKFTNLAPDLIVEFLRGVPKEAAGGSAFLVDACVKNIGTEDANPAFIVALYHSITNNISPGNTQIGVGTINGLAKGKSACVTITATLPATIARGTNWLGAIVDSTEVIQELNEANNVSKALAFQDTSMRIDLQFNSVTGMPAKLNPEDNITLNVCVKNTDTSNASVFKVGIYYSKDVIISIYEDSLIGSVNFANGVAGGKSACESISAQIPKLINPPPQGNWIGIVIDYELVIPETNKTNNIRTVRFEDAGGFPDLVIESIKGVPTLALPGILFQDIEICVRNIGRGVANPPIDLAMYHSKDEYIEYSDTLMAKHTFENSIDSGTSSCIKLGGQLPKNVNAGDNWLGAYVDFEEKIKEEKDDNNTKSVKFTVLMADLEVTSLKDIPKLAEAGDPITAEVCIKNKGTDDAKEAFKLGLFLSLNDGESEEKKQGEVDYPKGLAKDKSDCQKFNFNVPSPIDPGKKTVTAKVDFEKKVQEATRDNNEKSEQFLVPGPDLTISKFDISPDTGPPGTKVDITVCTQNIGHKDVPQAFVVRIFKSEDASIDNSDTKIHEIQYQTPDLPKFKAKEPEVCQTFSFNIPNDADEGRHYFGAFADADKEIKEEDENNNTTSQTFVVPSKEKPNLVIDSIKIDPAKQQPGFQIDTEICFGNYGNDIPETKSFKLGVFFDASATEQPKTKIYEFTPIDGMASQTKKCLKAKVTLPRPLLAGKYFVVAWIDFEDQIDESSTDDNRDATEIAIFIDHDLDGVPAEFDCDDRDDTVYPAHQGKPAAPELCDGKDNNCNGLIDEDFPDKGKPCTVGIGSCMRNGKYLCKKDKSTTECDATQGEPKTEVCNNQDDDCDGHIDNNEADQSCKADHFCIDGKCQVILCVVNAHCHSGLVCKGGICRKPRTCTSDPDCDKLESCINKLCTQQACKTHSECPPEDSLCLGEVCVPACHKNSDCSNLHFCIDGRCWKQCKTPDDCHKSQNCTDNVCQDICSPPCNKGQYCMAEKCVENTCYGYGCPNAQICLNTNCVRDPCYKRECAANQFCSLAHCINSCGDVNCADGERCDNGKCRPDSCANLNCPDEQLCIEGQCLADRCRENNQTCGSARFCKEGVCTDHPCAHVSCPKPNTETCVLDDKYQPQCVSQKSAKPETYPEYSPELNTETHITETTSEQSHSLPDADGHSEQLTEYTTNPDTPGNITPDEQLPTGCGCHKHDPTPIIPLAAIILLSVAFLSRRPAPQIQRCD